MVSELCTETLHRVVGCAGTRTRYRARVYTRYIGVVPEEVNAARHE